MRRATAMTQPGPPPSPAYLGRAGIALDPYRPSGERGWYCQPCKLRLQNGLTGAREHHLHVHVGLTAHLRLVAS